MYKALIVDDSEILRRTVMRSQLWGETSGFIIAGEAEDGLAALDIIKKTPVDLVITDIRMPHMDGIELLENISTNRLCPYVVLLSDFTEYSYARKGILFGAFDYIGKPIRDTELANLLDRIKKKLDAYEGQWLIERNVEVAHKPIIKCFSRFQFKADNREVKFSTHKAQEIFAYLLCNNLNQISRNELIEVFFSSGDEKKDANNLRVTIFRIRQTLLAANISKENILLKDDYSIRVAPGICDITDFNAFIHKNRMIDKSNITEADHIIDTFRGSLLTEMDTSWTDELREQVNVEAENLMLKMAMYYSYMGSKPLKAEYVLIKLIEHNPLSEQGHLALLDLCLRTNNKGKYTYYYRRYKENISKNLDCEPEEKYRIFYEKFSG